MKKASATPLVQAGRVTADEPPVADDVATTDSSDDLLTAQPHRRYNPLADEWVLVSPERTRRPWRGREEPTPPEDLPAYDPTCYLCPGNSRANGERNPAYESTFVFTNDFSALEPETTLETFEHGLLRAEGERGTCRVLCFSPRHDLHVARLAPADVRRVVDIWAEQTADLGNAYRWVQVFENRGETMGSSNPHPHGQVWAGSALPVQAAREDRAQQRHCDTTGRRLLLDYAEQERGGPRVVIDDPDWLVVVPFWALWPFETLVLPARPVERLPNLDGRRRDHLARVLIELLTRYDNLFDIPFPYSMGWHQAPFGGGSIEHWQLHGHVYPPLLRSARVRKFVAGYELLAETQRDLTPEEAADRLRSVGATHYLAGNAAPV